MQFSGNVSEFLSGSRHFLPGNRVPLIEIASQPGCSCDRQNAQRPRQQGFASAGEGEA
jgi:hypothetical protein